jgi:hypothetical protein
MICHQITSKGKANGEKLLKITSAKLKNRGGKTGITQLIFNVIEKLGACSVSELATCIWENDESGVATSHFKSYEVFNRFVAKVLHKLYASGKITALRFKTQKGRIYGISADECWKYLFDRGIAPERLIKTFMRLIGEQCFVTNIQLKNMGFTSEHIRQWIEKKLGAEGNYIMVHKVNEHIKVYFLPRYFGQLENYLNSPEFQEIYEKYCLERSFVHEAGKVLEAIVEELYRKMGYEYRKQFPIFDYHVREDKDPKNEDRKLIAFLDGLAFKKVEDGNSPNDLIIIECKNCMQPISFHQIAHLIYIRQIKFKGRGEIHIIALNGATKSVWNNIRFYPFIRVIGWKEFKEKCEKYKPETYVKVKERFGDFRLAVACARKEIVPSDKFFYISDETRRLWKSGDEL